MAGELKTEGQTGLATYGLIFDPASANVYNGTSFVAYVTANRNTYARTMTELGVASGIFIGDMPALAAAAYDVLYYQEPAAGGPAETDQLCGTQSIPWNGSSPIGGLDLTTPVPTSNTPNTLGDCLNAARAQGFGKWVIDKNAKTLTLYAPDGVTVVRTFNLDSVTAPLQRV